MEPSVLLMAIFVVCVGTFLGAVFGISLGALLCAAVVAAREALR